ncbi:phosphoethanolamine transferase [Helicobacter sp. T3_23-1059]
MLIIGESTQRNYMSVYGYPLPTTPHLGALQKSGNLYAFRDIVAPATHTNEALKYALTFHNYENKEIAWHTQMNIIDAMKALGYKTAWFSNQDSISVWGNVFQAISKRAHFTQYSTNRGSLENALYDEILLKMFAKYRANQDLRESKIYTRDSHTDAQDSSESNAQDLHSNSQISQDSQFIVFHLMGTHGHYEHRYPKDKATFAPQDLRAKSLDRFYGEDKKPLNDAQLQMRTDYANVVAYNDEIVAQIIKEFENDEAIVFYFSDHCDEVFDERDFLGHTYSFVSRYMVEIPFMIYMSDKFKKAHPNIEKRVKKAQNLPFMTDNFMHAFFDLLGIECADLDYKFSLFSPKFNANRARIIYGVDYDKELKNKAQFLVPNKIWLHRVDEIAKLERYFGEYGNFEIDVHFFDENLVRQVGKEKPYFDVGHDGVEKSIGLDLSEMLEIIVAKNKAFYGNVKNHKNTSKIWVDFKNLDSNNAKSALKELKHIVAKTDFGVQNIIVESGDFVALKAFRDAGFYTSYYVPYYTQDELKSADRIKAHLENVATSGNVNALSFPYYLYDFTKSLGLKNAQGRDIDLLTWNEGQSWREQAHSHKVFDDAQIKVILAGEKGAWR